MTVTIERGQPAPIPVPPSEGVFPALDGASVAIWGFLSGLADQEIMAWRKGKLSYGLWVRDDIPFLNQTIECSFRHTQTPFQFGAFKTRREFA